MSKFTQLTKPDFINDRSAAALKFAEASVITKDVVTNSVEIETTRSTYAPEGYRRLTINLPETLHKKLRMKAVEQNTTATEIIEKLLSQELS